MRSPFELSPKVRRLLGWWLFALVLTGTCCFVALIPRKIHIRESQELLSKVAQAIESRDLDLLSDSEITPDAREDLEEAMQRLDESDEVFLYQSEPGFFGGHVHTRLELRGDQGYSYVVLILNSQGLQAEGLMITQTYFPEPPIHSATREDPGIAHWE